MIKHWFTADLHLFHNNIIKYCNRSKYMNEQERKLYVEHYDELKISNESTNLMNHDLIGQINLRACKDDHLWILGDVGFKSFKKECRNFLDSLICKNVHLIWGNHDSQDIAQYFSSCHNMVDLCIFQDGRYVTDHDSKFHWNKQGNTNMFLCHYAMVTWDRAYKNPNKPVYHLYGHTHTNLEKEMNEKFPDRNSADVGVDNVFRVMGYYGPISHLDIPDFIKKNKNYET